MTKKKYVAQIQPNISKEDEQKLNRQFKNVAKGMKTSMGSALKVGIAVGATGILMGWWNHQKKSIDAVNKSFDDYLANTDRLSTIANDLQANSGSFAMQDMALSTYGLSQEDRDKLYASIKSAVADGTIVNKDGGNSLGAIIGLQDEYVKALGSGDIKRQVQLKELTGLRGQKATEFLSADLRGSIEILEGKLKGKFSKKDIELAVNKGGDMERVQAESLAIRQIESIVEVAKVANEGIIKSQEEYNLALRQSTLQQYGNYDVMVEEQLAREQIARNVNRLISSWLNPIIGDLSKLSASNYDTVFIKILKDLVSKIWGVIGDMFRQGRVKAMAGINSFMNDIPLLKRLMTVLNGNSKPKTETDKKRTSSQGSPARNQ